VVRSAGALTLASLVLAACGDPLIVLGDAPGRMRIVVGVGDSIGTRIDSVATRTRLADPTGIAFDASSGVLFAADRGALVQSGGSTRRVARLFSVRSDGRLTLVFSTANCPANCPEAVHSLAVAPNAAVYITDVVGHRVFRLDPGSTAPAMIAGSGTAGDSPDGALAAGSRIRSPAGIAVAPDGRIYFAEQAGHRVRVIDPDGRLRTVAGTGTAGVAGDGGPASTALLNNPAGIALGGDVLYIADRLNQRIRAVSLTTGIITTVAGQGSAGYSGDGGDAAVARFDRPESVALSSDLVTLFVADYGNHRVRAVNLGTRVIQSIAGTGSVVWSGAGRPAGETSLEWPSGVATGLGFLFIADFGHSVVWRTVIRL
jgi:hypothetical protein